MNLYATLRDGFAHRFDEVALRVPGSEISGTPETEWLFSDLDRRSGEWAQWLESEGIAPGDRVLVQTPKSVENLALYLGALRAGGVFVTLNTAYTAAELEYFVADASPSLVICDPGAPVAAPCPVRFLDADGMGSAVEGVDRTAEAMGGAAGPITHCDPSDPAAMLYTSGTTGRSKGAVLSHSMLAANGHALCDLWAMSSNDVLLHTLPIFHVHGLFTALHCALLAGSTMVFLPRFETEEVLAALPHSTVLMGVPTHYNRLLGDERFNPQTCANMRLFTSGSAPMTEATHRDFEQRTGTRILERYGMTETGIITSNPLDGERVVGSVGFALPGFELRIADEHGTRVPTGETGSVEIRCSALFNGYHGKPEKTEESYHEGGWFITGDVGMVDVEGRLTLEGRSSDMIISGGLNVYPKEVELVLDACDNVIDSAVIGAPHPDFGEGVIAVIAGTATEEQLRQQVATNLAGFKRPKAWFFVDTLPRNAMGKVQKSALRSQLAETFTGPQ